MFILQIIDIVSNLGPVAQRITRLTTDQKIPGSNPGRIGWLFFSIKKFYSTEDTTNKILSIQISKL